jgi:hypothetical protein
LALLAALAAFIALILLIHGILHSGSLESNGWDEGLFRDLLTYVTDDLTQIMELSPHMHRAAAARVNHA